MSLDAELRLSVLSSVIGVTTNLISRLLAK